MKKTKKLTIISTLILLTLSLILTNCNRFELRSSWKENDIIVDGINSEWKNSLNYFENKNSSIGVRNDDKSLYICFINNDPALRRQILTRGLVVWIKPETSRKKIGLKFPLGMQFDGQRNPNAMRGEGDRGTRLDMLDFDFSEIEVLGPEKDDMIRLQISGEKGIDAKINIKENIFIYELRIALDNHDIFMTAVNSAEKPKISIEFEVPRIQRPSNRSAGASSGMDGGGRSGGRGGGGGGRMGGVRGGGKRPGGSSQRSMSAGSGFNLKLDVTLSQASTPAEE